MKRAFLTIAVMATVAGVSVGCSALPGSLTPSTPSASTSASPSSGYGKQAMCALGSAGVSLIRAGGAGSKALAELIAANAQDQNVKNMANAVINSTASDDVRNQLADWLNSYCS